MVVATATGVGTGVSALLTTIIGARMAMDLLTIPDPMRMRGTVDAEHQTNLSDHYGFGADKRLLVINLTEMGGLGPMHPYDKAHATMRAYGASLHADEDPEDGSTLYDIGIEYKGMGQRNDPTGNRRVQGA